MEVHENNSFRFTQFLHWRNITQHSLELNETFSNKTDPFFGHSNSDKTGHALDLPVLGGDMAISRKPIIGEKAAFTHSVEL